MRTTLNVDDKLIESARELTGIQEKTALIKLALETLVSLEAGKRLAAMGGTMPDLKMVPRRRMR